MSCPLSRMAKTGPSSPMTGPKLGMKVISPAISAHRGASGTPISSSPTSHRTAQQNASIETARHQFTSALPAVVPVVLRSDNMATRLDASNRIDILPARLETSDGSPEKALHSVIKQAVDIGFGKRSCPHLQPVIHGRVKQVYGCFEIDVWSQDPLADRLLENAYGQSAPGQRPSFAKLGCQLRIELGFGQQRLHERPVPAPEGPCHRPHLQLYAVGGLRSGRKQRPRADPQHEGIHDDGSFVRPSAVNG